VNRQTYNRIAMTLAAIIAALGFAILIRTAAEGGGTAGYVIGALFVALGSGRVYLLWKRG
jgi:hypothetical protein